MHLFLYFGVFHLDRVPEARVPGFEAHAGWLGSVSKVWTWLHGGMGQRWDLEPCAAYPLCGDLGSLEGG